MNKEITPEQIKQRSEAAKRGAETRKKNKAIQQDADREMLGDDADYFEHAGITFGDK